MAFDVMTELLLFGISMYMLHGLTLKITKKLIVLSAFALRLPSVSHSPTHIDTSSLKMLPGLSYQPFFASTG